MVKKTLRIRITVYIEYRRMTDGQTNGQTNGRTDGRTDGQTSCHGIVSAMHTRRAVIMVFCPSTSREIDSVVNFDSCRDDVASIQRNDAVWP